MDKWRKPGGKKNTATKIKIKIEVMFQKRLALYSIRLSVASYHWIELMSPIIKLAHLISLKFGLYA